mgnify:CR=1 FL=1
MLYLDVLVLLNAGIGAVFLLAAGKLARRKTSRWRLTLSALAAGGYSLVLLLALPGWLLLLLQLPVSLGLVLLCYGKPCGCCSAFGAATFCWERCWGFWTSGWRP